MAASVRTHSWVPSLDYTDCAELVLSRLASNVEQGLSPRQAAERLEKEGPNKIGKAQTTTVIGLLINQFASSVVVLLIVCAVISTLLHEYLQTVGIVVAIFVNAAVGFLTEYQARLSLQKLASLSGSSVRVRRDGQEYNLAPEQLVRGDIVLLEPGDRIPADLKLTGNLPVSVDESILTGESVSVEKTGDCGVNSNDSILFQGTTLTNGRAVAIVISTGQETRLGQLSITLAELETTKTPLERMLDGLGHRLTVVTVLLCAVFAIVGILRGLRPLMMLETSIALAVAAIPEGLPVVATLALAFGIQKMIKYRALVRRLPAVETLGCATIICTDKTGTLTENRMVVTELVGYEERYQISGEGFIPIGEITNRDFAERPVERLHVQKLMIPAILANDARLENHGDDWHIHGDATEGALLVAGAKLELDQATISIHNPRLAELPFDLTRRRMSTINRVSDDKFILACKGGPRSVMSTCTKVLVGDAVFPLTEERLRWFEAENKRLAESGLRVLALATKAIDSLPVCIEASTLEKELTLLSLVAMCDPPKSGVTESIAECKRAGIRVMMLTGDQADTAFAVGEQLNLCESRDELMSGEELTKMSNEDFATRLRTASIFSRVTPELKLAIVRKLRELGEVVAMTGDGINDAPALRQADIGVAMGKSGSDMARDASALVITDDNFSTIVTAVSQGRQIYNKIRSAIAYLLTASVASLGVTCSGVLLHASLVLTPLQLLYLNLIMHVFPALGLVMQSNWDDLMSSPPRARNEELLSHGLANKIWIRAAAVVAVTLIAGILDITVFGGGAVTSAVLTTIAASLVLQSWTWLASPKGAQTGKSLSQFLPMISASIICVVLIFAALYLPGLSDALETKPLSIAELSVSFLLSLVAFVPFAHSEAAS